MSRSITHLVGCIGPLLAIFLLPLFGVSDGLTLLVFIALMFACHLVMSRGHRHASTESLLKEPPAMNTLSFKRLGFAIGSTCAVLYLGCVFVMLVLPPQAAVRFFNSIMHGWDVEPLMRWDMPWWEAVIGVVEFFVLGWLSGAIIAALYNISARPRTPEDA